MLKEVKIGPEVYSTQIEGVKIIRQDAHVDDRGAFFESFNQKQYESLGLPLEWPQDNVSYSHFGVLRGLHIQTKNPQGKLIRCLAGSVWDCWVDLRKGSPTFGKWEGLTMGGESIEAVYLPPGLAHGFLVIGTFALLHYKCTTLYDKESDGGIIWDDPTIGIEWPMEHEMSPIVSVKDSKLISLDEYSKSLG